MHKLAAAFLKENGFNLFGVLDTCKLPIEIQNLFPKEIDLKRYKRLIVIGNGGRDMWESLIKRGPLNNNPIDSFSIQIMERLCSQYLSKGNNKILYPNEAYTLPLQRIGKHLGWSSSSPLGIGINKQYGLWWAYRGALLTNTEFKLTTINEAESPCDNCLDKPCITHCPGTAVSDKKVFNITACFNHRTKIDSSCVDRCLSRNACPISQNQQYPTEMTKYIYKNSMATVHNYLKQGDSFPH